MKFKWNDEKNNKLKKERGLGFEDIIAKIHQGFLLDRISNKTRKNQEYLIVNYDGYIVVVPFVVEPDGTFFLKTYCFNRKYTKQYIGDGK